jgi:HlyD family secretion protein
MNDSPRTHRWPWIVGILLLAGTGIGARFALKGGEGEPAKDENEKAAGPSQVLCIGYVDVEPGVAHLHPVQQGIIEDVAKEGTPVEQGVVILQLDQRPAKAKVDEAKAALDAADKQLEKATKLFPEELKNKIAQQEKAVKAAEATRKATEEELRWRKEFEKIADSVIKGYTYKLETMQAAKDAEELKLQALKEIQPKLEKLEIARAEAEKAAKKAQLDQAQWLLDQCALKAPADGTILRVSVQKGEVLGANPQAPAIEFLPKGDRMVRAEVLQEWASRVHIGQKVIIEDDTFVGKTYDGEVTRLSDWFARKRHPVIEPFMMNDVRTMECLVKITSTDVHFRIGQRVRVRILTENATK